MELPPPELLEAEPIRRVRHWKKVLLLTLMLGALTAFLVLGGRGWLSLDTLKEHREGLLAFTRQNYASMLVGAIVAYTLATALNFPMGFAMSMAMGLLFGRWVGTAAVVVAATVGATLAFTAARYLFAEAVRRRMGPRVQRLVRAYDEDAFNYILFTRLVPVFPFWLMNLVPAFTPVKARTFFFATLFGIIPGSFVFVNLGESLARIESGRDLLSRQTMLALTLLGVMGLIPIFWKRMRTSGRRSDVQPE